MRTAAQNPSNGANASNGAKLVQRCERLQRCELVQSVANPSNGAGNAPRRSARSQKSDAASSRRVARGPRRSATDTYREHWTHIFGETREKNAPELHDHDHDLPTRAN